MHISVAVRTVRTRPLPPNKQNLPYIKVGHLDAVSAFTKSNFMSQQGLQGVKRYRHIQKCIALVAAVVHQHWCSGLVLTYKAGLELNTPVCDYCTSSDYGFGLL